MAIEQKDLRILPDMGVRVSFLEEMKKGGTTGSLRKGCSCRHRQLCQRDGDMLVVVGAGRLICATCESR